MVEITAWVKVMNMLVATGIITIDTMTFVVVVAIIGPYCIVEMILLRILRRFLRLSMKKKNHRSVWRGRETIATDRPLRWMYMVLLPRASPTRCCRFSTTHLQWSRRANGLGLFPMWHIWRRYANRYEDGVLALLFVLYFCLAMHERMTCKRKNKVQILTLQHQ